MECEVCGRKLKSAKSMERGIGPGCWKKINGSDAKTRATRQEKINDTEEFYIPGQMELEEWIDSMKNTEEK